MFENKLDSIFVNRRYWHGNEPGHQIPFLYNYTNASYKTQEQVHLLLREEYGIGTGGLSGNDDAGQMSAWYVMASIGIYPVNPASTEYTITSSLFSKITIHLQVDKSFIISNKNTSDKSIFIKNISLNGRQLLTNFINHRSIMRSGALVLETSETPIVK